MNTYVFLIPLLTGFGFNLASALTAAHTRRWGERGGRLASFIMRNILGIPVWALGFILAYRQSSALLFVPGLATEILGWLLVAGGCILIVLALLPLGRRSVMPSVQDTLVDSGVYAHIRHPIYSGVLLEFIGLVILRPRIPAIVACVLGCCWIVAQARLEEFDLLQRIPAYHQYMMNVPRFMPRVRKNGAG
jgi:protein-S-isoprenylcysteine O-methyltransferase Ste14